MQMDAKEIGNKLIKLRGDKTQESVAKDLGLSVSAISMYESGNRIPRDSVKIRIARYYNISITELFYA